MIFPINVHRRAVNARKLVAQDKTAITVVLLMLVFLCVRNAGNKNTTTEDPNANQPQGVEVSSEVEIIE